MPVLWQVHRTKLDSSCNFVKTIDVRDPILLLSSFEVNLHCNLKFNLICLAYSYFSFLKWMNPVFNRSMDSEEETLPSTVFSSAVI